MGRTHFKLTLHAAGGSKTLFKAQGDKRYGGRGDKPKVNICLQVCGSRQGLSSVSFYELGKQQSDLMAWNPSHTISQELPPQTHTWTTRVTQESRQGNMHHTDLMHVHLPSPPSPDPAASTSQSHGAHAHLRPSPNTHQPTAQLSLLAFSSALGHSRN